MLHILPILIRLKGKYILTQTCSQTKRHIIDSNLGTEKSEAYTD